MGFFSAIGKGARAVGNGAKAVINHSLNKNLGQAARDLNNAGGGLARWALQLPGNHSRGVQQHISDTITGGLQNFAPTAGIGRHLAGHNLFGHDQGDGYGIFEPGKDGGSNGAGGRNRNGGGNRNNFGNGGYGNIYHFHNNNYGHTYNNYGSGTMNTGNVTNNVNNNGGNIGNIGGHGSQGYAHMGGPGPLVNHLANAYVDSHIQSYQPRVVSSTSSPVKPPQKMLTGPQYPQLTGGDGATSSSAVLPPSGGNMTMKAASKPSAPQYDENGSFIGKRRVKIPGPSFSPVRMDKPQIESPIIGKPQVNPNAARVSLPRGTAPSETMPTFTQTKPIGTNVNHVTNPTSGENEMNSVQASLITKKAFEMLAYIDDVYAMEPENVRYSLALDAAEQFYKNAAEAGMDVPEIDTSMPTMPTPKEDKTVDPNELYAKVHPDVIQTHLEKAQQINPNITSFDDIIHGRYPASDGTEFSKGKRFTTSKSEHARVSPDPKKQERLYTGRFHQWMEDHVHPTLTRLSGVSGQDLEQENAKAEKTKNFEKGKAKGKRGIEDVVNDYGKKNKDDFFAKEEPVPGMTGSDIPLGKHDLMRTIRRELNTPYSNTSDNFSEEEQMPPRSEAELIQLLRAHYDATPHQTLEEKKKHIPVAYHGYLDDIHNHHSKGHEYKKDYKDNQWKWMRPAGSATADEIAKGQELARRTKEYEELKNQGFPPEELDKRYKGVDLPSASSKREEKDLSKSTRRRMEKGDFNPGGRMDAPIDNSELATDQEHADARQMARDEYLEDMGLGEDASKDEAFQQRLRERNERIPEHKRKGKVDLDRGGKGIAAPVEKRNPAEKKDSDIGRAKEIARGDEYRRLNQENERDNSPLARSKSKNTGESGKSRKKHQASKFDELRIITAGMNSYEIEAIADGLLNLGYSVDDIFQIAEKQYREIDISPKRESTWEEDVANGVSPMSYLDNFSAQTPKNIGSPFHTVPQAKLPQGKNKIDLPPSQMLHRQASDCEDINGSTSAVTDAANVKDSDEIPDWIKRGLH